MGSYEERMDLFQQIYRVRCHKIEVMVTEIVNENEKTKA